MSEATQIMESLRSDVAALNAAVAANKTDVVNTLTAKILEQKTRIDALETAAARSAAVDGIRHTLEVSAHRKAFKTYVQTGNELELRTVGAVGDGTGAAGGLTVPQEIDTNVTKLIVSLSDLRPHANVVKIGAKTDAWRHNVNLGTAAGGWVAETGERAKTNVASVGRVTITPAELYARPETTLQLIEDSSFDVEAWYTSETAETLSVLEGTAFINGSGSDQPKGLLTYTQNSLGTSTTPSGTPDYTKIQTITCETALTITVGDISALVGGVKTQVLKNAKFYGNRAIKTKLSQLKDSTGRLLWVPSLAAGVPDLLAGYPFVELPDMPASLVGSGSPVSTPLALGFGDMKRTYTIADKNVSLTTQRDTITNPGFVNFYTRRRVGGGLVDGTSMVFLKIKQS